VAAGLDVAAGFGADVGADVAAGAELAAGPDDVAGFADGVHAGKSNNDKIEIITTRNRILFI
jgi:hypothetical protein